MTYTSDSFPQFLAFCEQLVFEQKYELPPGLRSLRPDLLFLSYLDANHSDVLFFCFQVLRDLRDESDLPVEGTHIYNLRRDFIGKVFNPNWQPSIVPNLARNGLKFLSKQLSRSTNNYPTFCDNKMMLLGMIISSNIWDFMVLFVDNIKNSNCEGLVDEKANCCLIGNFTEWNDLYIERWILEKTYDNKIFSDKNSIFVAKCLFNVVTSKTVSESRKFYPLQPQSHSINSLNYAKWLTQQKKSKSWDDQSYLAEKDANIPKFYREVKTNPMTKKKIFQEKALPMKIQFKDSLIKKLRDNKNHDLYKILEPQINIPNLTNLLPNIQNLFPGDMSHNIQFSENVESLVSKVTSIIDSLPQSTAHAVAGAKDLFFDGLESILKNKATYFILFTISLYKWSQAGFRVYHGVDPPNLKVGYWAMLAGYLGTNVFCDLNRKYSTFFWCLKSALGYEHMDSDQALASTMMEHARNHTEPGSEEELSSILSALNVVRNMSTDLLNINEQHLPPITMESINNIRANGLPHILHAQSGGGLTNTMFDLIAKLKLFTIANVLEIFKDVQFSKKNLLSMITLIGGFQRTVDGFNSIIEFIKWAMERLVNFIRTQVLGKTAMHLFPLGIDVVDRWVNNIIRVVEDKDLGRFTVNMENYNRVASLRLESDFILIHHSKSAANGVVRDIVIKYLKLLQPVQDMLAQANLGSNETRMEPLAVCISGASGVGKTGMSVPFIQDVLSCVLPIGDQRRFVERPNDFIYQRLAEHKYWDGYRGQPACIFDDFLQAREANGDPDSEAMSIIRCSGSFPYITHMAGLDQKGSTNFISNILFASTNHTKINPQSIHYPEAVVRRFDLVYKCEVVPEYQIGGSVMPYKLDTRKVRDKFPSRHFVEEVYRFVPWDSLNDVPSEGPHLTYRQLVDKAISIYKEKHGKADQLINELRLRREYNSLSAEKASSLTDLSDLSEETSTAIVQMENLPCSSNIESDSDSDLDEEELLESFDDKKGKEKEISVYENILGANEYSDQLNQMNKVDNKIYIKAIDSTINESVDFALPSAGFTRDAARVWFHNGFIKYCKKAELCFKKISTIDNFKKIFEKSLPIVFWHNISSTLFKMTQIVNVTCKDCSRHSYSRVKELFSDATNFCVAHKKGIAICTGLLAALTAFLIGKDLLKSLDFDQYIGSQSTDSERSGTRANSVSNLRAAKAKVRFVKTARPEVADSHLEPQGTADETTQAFCESVCKRNMYELVSSNGYKFGKCLMIKDDVAMIPFHYLCLFQDIVEGKSNLPLTAKLVNNCSSRSFEVNINDLVLDDNIYVSDNLSLKDVYLCRIPNMTRHRNIVKSFMDKDYIESKEYFPVSMYSLSSSIVHCADADGKIVNLVHVKDDVGELYEVVGTIEYNINTKRGDCGSLIAFKSNNPRFGRVLGIHIAGDPKTNSGFASIIPRQLLESEIKEMEISLVSVEPQMGTGEFLFGDKLMPIIRRIEKPAFRSFESALRKSKLYGTYAEAKTDIARLGRFKHPEKGVVDPMYEALKKYTNPIVEISPKILEMASNDLFHHLNNSSLGKAKNTSRLLTFEEAIEGVYDFENSHGMPRDTSPGWPYNTGDRPMSKADLFGTGQTPDFSRPQSKALKLRILLLQEELANGKVPFLPFTGTLKDERRALLKVFNGLSRYVAACSIYSFILFKIYFGHFISSFQSAGMEIGAMIGVDPFSSAWNILARRLKSKDETCVGDGDFKSFDSSITPQITEVVLKYINNHYDDNCSKIRVLLWTTINYSYHIIDGNVIMWKGKEPSGHAMTATLNCLANMIIFRVTWYDIMSDTKYVSVPFSQMVVLVVMGDDNALNVDKRVHDLYNPISITKSFKKIGFTYTAADKDAENSFWKPLEECKFLKRSFRFDKNLHRYVAPLSLDTILDIPMWYRKGNLEEAAVRGNVAEALKELCLHDTKTYNEWGAKIRDACMKHYKFAPFLPDRISKMRSEVPE